VGGGQTRVGSRNRVLNGGRPSDGKGHFRTDVYPTSPKSWTLVRTECVDPRFLFASGITQTIMRGF